MPRRPDKDILNEAGVVAKFIREKRKALGYTQEELALRAGVGLRFLRDLEHGKKTARMDKVNQMLNYFGFELIPGRISKEDL